MIPALALAALALAPGNSGTLWLGPQAVTVSFTASNSGAGMPRACATNNGPHTIRIVRLAVTDPTHTISDRGRTLRRGGRQCLSRDWIRVDGAYASFAAVDQRTGANGATDLPLSSVLEPVRPVAITAAVQAAVGVTPDGDWGPITEAAVNRVRAAAHGHYGVLTATVEALQRAFGVGVDGSWGPNTDDGWLQARNAALGRY